MINARIVNEIVGKALSMKRLFAPVVQRYEKESSGYHSRIIRESYPPHWLLSELLLHITSLCVSVHGKTSAGLLLNLVLSIPKGMPLKANSGGDTLFNRTYTIGYDKYQGLYNEYEKTVSAEERAAWSKMSVIDGIDASLKKRDESIPQYQNYIDIGNFFFGEYRHLPDELRTVTDLAFSGFIYTTLNSPDFPSLCKNKDLDVSAMTFEQKLDAELDHEAFYNALLVKLGHA